MKKFLGYVGAGVVLGTGFANAALGDGFSPDMAPIGVIAAAMLTALGVIWTARKVIGMVRS